MNKNNKNIHFRHILYEFKKRYIDYKNIIILKLISVGQTYTL